MDVFGNLINFYLVSSKKKLIRQSKGTPGFICCSFKSGAFLCLESDFIKYFLAITFLFGAYFQNLFWIQLFPNFSYTQQIKTTSYLPRLYIYQQCGAKPNEAGLCD